jgi:hypothetical protein
VIVNISHASSLSTIARPRNFILSTRLNIDWKVVLQLSPQLTCAQHPTVWRSEPSTVGCRRSLLQLLTAHSSNMNSLNSRPLLHLNAEGVCRLLICLLERCNGMTKHVRTSVRVLGHAVLHGSWRFVGFLILYLRSEASSGKQVGGESPFKVNILNS